MGGAKERKYFDSADYSMNKDVQQQQTAAAQVQAVASQAARTYQHARCNEFCADVARSSFFTAELHQPISSVARVPYPILRGAFFFQLMFGE